MRTPRVYLAARFARQLELRQIAEELCATGAQVTSRWIFSERPLDQDELSGSGRGAELALMDFDDLKASDICVAFAEEPHDASGRGGRHTELGIALALNMRVVLVGPREHIFHCLPTVEHYKSWDEARHVLLGNREAPEESLGRSRAAERLAVLR